ncbi:MAG TPA: hypothetical protein VFZ17_15110 [Acidimicrobiia bacterium]|nr:hypothetical protein [Acidimicrobiia bacterium]
MRVSRLRLVFGPADTLADVLRALADALDPLDLVPTSIEWWHSTDGHRMRVECELDPARPDVAFVLGHLLRRRHPEPRGDATGAAA